MDTLIPYMRKSSGEDPEGSLARQRGAIRRWAEQNDVTLGPEVWEPHVSGKTSWTSRGLGQAIAAVERGEAAGIVCEEQSRLSRENMKATAEVWEALEHAGARLVCTAEGIDTATGDHELRFNINAALAREQWKQYARRMADMKARKIEAGIWIGPVPLGFAKNADKTLRVDPTMARLVVALYEARLAGAGIPTLARKLEADTGRTWSNQGVRQILANELYMTGRPRYGDLVGPEVERGRLVDVATWHAVQKMRQVRPPRSDGRWLLTGLATCATCGRNLHPVSDGAGHRRYRCANRACPGRVSVSARWAETVFTRLTFARSTELVTRSQAPDLAALEDALAKAEARLSQVMADGVADELGDLWAPEVGRRRRARDEAASALGEARQESGTDQRTFRLEDVWDDLGPADRREALRLFWKEIRVGRKAPGGDTPVTLVARGPGAEAEVDLPAA